MSAPEFSGYIRGSCAVSISNGSEIGIFDFRVNPGMMLSKVADANNSHSERHFSS
jgi:hypothetical protein